MVLTQIPKVGFKTLVKTAAALSCELYELRDQTQASLTTIGWSGAQIDALKGPVIYLHRIKYWLSQSASHSIVCFDNTAYPALLRQISQPPLVLFCAGNVELLEYDYLAVVGSRRVSRDGQLNTQALVASIVTNSQLGIVSGLALGVDALAHQICLQHQGNTIAVLGCGINVVYPARHKALFAQIKDVGLLLSEFMPGTKPEAHFFPRRNRIISGLSLGTMVTEAQIKSGTLLTANYAIEQDREVFAVPGNIRNPNAKGCHWLIKQGATLTESVDDILDGLGLAYKKQAIDKEQSIGFVKNNKQSLATDLLLDSVDYDSTPIDVIAMRTSMSIPDLLATLLDYEMRGLVASTSQGYIKLRE